MLGIGLIVESVLTIFNVVKVLVILTVPKVEVKLSAWVCVDVGKLVLEIVVVKIDNEVVAIKEIKEESVIVSAVDKLNAIEVFSGTLVVIEVILVEDRDKVEVKRVDKIVVECIKPIVFVFKMNDDESVVVKVLVESDGVVKLVETDVVDEIILLMSLYLLISL